MIFSINTRSSVLYDTIKETLSMTDHDVYDFIQDEFAAMRNRLKVKHIDYASLKKALVPNQAKDRHELCLVIDSLAVSDGNYGFAAFEKILQAIDKNSTYSILTGDYLDRLQNHANDSQELLRKALYEVLSIVNPSHFIASKQYYLVYINSITSSQAKKIIDHLTPTAWFHGYAFLDNDSVFKSYIAYTIGTFCIKTKDKVICAHPVDYDDTENVNMRGYPFEENGFSVVSINEDSFSVFLDYKIETSIKDENDEGFSFNALFPKFDNIKKLSLNISKEKFQYLCSDSTGKDGILKSFGYTPGDRDVFQKMVYDKICQRHIFNLDLNEYGIFKFNVCIDIPTTNGNTRKTTIALKYYSDTGIMDLITIT